MVQNALAYVFITYATSKLKDSFHKKAHHRSSNLWCPLVVKLASGWLTADGTLTLWSINVLTWVVTPHNVHLWALLKDMKQILNLVRLQQMSDVQSSFSTQIIVEFCTLWESELNVVSKTYIFRKWGQAIKPSMRPGIRNKTFIFKFTLNLPLNILKILSTCSAYSTCVAKTEMTEITGRVFRALCSPT